MKKRGQRFFSFLAAAIVVFMMLSSVSNAASNELLIKGVTGPGAADSQLNVFTQNSAGKYAETSLIETNATPSDTYSVKFKVKIVSDIIDGSSIRIVVRAVSVQDSLVLFLCKDGHLELHPLTDSDGAAWGWRNVDPVEGNIGALAKDKEYNIEIKSSPDKLWLTVDNKVILNGINTPADYRIAKPSATTFGFRSDYANIVVSGLEIKNADNSNLSIKGVTGPGAADSQFNEFTQNSAGKYAETSLIETNVAPSDTYSVKFKVKIVSDLVDGSSIRIVVRAVSVQDSLVLFLSKDGHLELHPLTDSDGAAWGWRNVDPVEGNIGALAKDKEYSIEIKSSPDKLWLTVDNKVILNGISTPADYKIAKPTATTFGFRSDYANIVVNDLEIIDEAIASTANTTGTATDTNTTTNNPKTGDNSIIFYISLCAISIATFTILKTGKVLSNKLYTK